MLKPALPNMSGALRGWMQPLEFWYVGKKQKDFKTTEVKIRKKTWGVRTPLTGQQLFLKPEGERAWKWEAIYCLPNLKLNIDDIIVFGTTRYRVMQKNDYGEYGYLEYHIIQDYQKLG